MADRYGYLKWLDVGRRGTRVFTDAVHPLCVCVWDFTRPDTELPSLPAWELNVRRRDCRIHGEKGSI